MSHVAWNFFLLFQINCAEPQETSFAHCKWSSNQTAPHDSHEHSQWSQEQLFETVHVSLEKEAQASCNYYSFITPKYPKLGQLLEYEWQKISWRADKRGTLLFHTKQHHVSFPFSQTEPAWRQNAKLLKLCLHRVELGFSNTYNFAKWSMSMLALI